MRLLTLGLVLAALPASLGVGWQVVTHDVGATPRHVRLAPLDGDAVADLVHVSGADGALQPNQLVVWRGLGDGRFERHWGQVVVTDFGQNGVPLEVADVDADGLNDLILGNVGGTGGFTVRLGDGSGTFPIVTIGPSFGGYIDDVVVVDYDGDGFLDVGTTTLDFGWYVDRFNGAGDGGFGSALPFSSFSGGNGVHELASADVTGDGQPEDLVSSPDGLLLVSQTSQATTLLDMPTDRAVATDLDGDGLADIAVTAPLEHAVVVLASLGGGTFAAPASVTTGRRPGGLVAADLDNDGDLDLASANAGARSVSLLTNDGRGGFAETGRVAVGSGPVDLDAADLDGDGDLDLAVANAGDRTISVLLNPHL